MSSTGIQPHAVGGVVPWLVVVEYDWSDELNKVEEKKLGNVLTNVLLKIYSLTLAVIVQNLV